MNNRSRLAVVLVCGLPPLTGCSNLFMQKYAKVRTWQLDEHSKVILREERERNIAVTDRWHNYNRDVMIIDSNDASEPQARVVMEEQSAPNAPADFSKLAKIGVRSDEMRQAVWVVDKRENRVLWGVVRAIEDSPLPPDFHRPEMTPTSGITLQEITPNANKT